MLPASQHSHLLALNVDVLDSTLGEVHLGPLLPGVEGLVAVWDDVGTFVPGQVSSLRGEQPPSSRRIVRPGHVRSVVALLR